MKKQNIVPLAAAIFILLIGHLNAQSQFQVSTGGTASETSSSIIQTTDGGFVIAGGTTIFQNGYNAIYIVKYSASGNLQWTRTIGDPNDSLTLRYANSIVQSTDGGFVLAGLYGGSQGIGNIDVYIIKLNGDGIIQWSKIIGGTGLDDAYSIIRTTNGGFAIAGYTTSYGAGLEDMFILKLDGSGNLLWSTAVGGISLDYASSIIQTTDGGYAIAGATYSFAVSGVKMFIVKLDSGGNFLWTRTTAGPNSVAWSITQTSDGGLVAAGASGSIETGDCYFVKLNSSGMLQWNRTVGSSFNDGVYSITQTSDGGLAAAGTSNSFGGGLDIYILKLDAGGNLVWSRSVGGTGTDYAFSIIQTSDSGYALTGYTDSYGAGGLDIYTVKFDANWNTCGNNSTLRTSTSGTNGSTASPIPLVTSPTPMVVSQTSPTGSFGTSTAICSFVGIQSISNGIPKRFSLYQNYPNPFNPATNIKFQIPARSSDGSKSCFASLIIYDELGQEITTLINEQLKPGTYEVEWNAANNPSGIYFYRLKIHSEGSSADNFIETRKMILIK